MDIDRRLTTATCALLTGVALLAWPQPLGLDTPAGRWHPMARSLLDRADASARDAKRPTLARSNRSSADWLNLRGEIGLLL